MLMKSLKIKIKGDEKMDIKITCKECGAEFLFTESENKFYLEKGFEITKRCKECRRNARKRRKENRE